MAINRETVEYVAHLARLELKPGELDKLAVQLKDILGFIDKLSKLDVSNIKPTSHILPLNNVLREDKLQGSLPIEKTLANAPQKEKSFFVVPRVIE
jgi:aspartyl-tRNA(Asn)/glutamyl-tRNA(Gln) amidotransferase subunit C